MRKTCLIFLGILLILTNSTILTQGIPIILTHTDDPDGISQALPIVSQKIEVSINNGYVVTNISQVYINHHDMEIQGTYLFAIPEDAFISNFSLINNGIKYYGKIFPKERAQEQYQEAVEAGRTAALLEYVGRKQFMYSISIAPKEDIEVEIVYEQFLRKRFNKYTYVHPLETKEYEVLVESLIMDIKIRSHNPISNIESVGYEFSPLEMSANFVRLQYTQEFVTPEMDLILAYDVAAPQDEGTLLVANREEPNYFMYAFSPSLGAGVTALPKDIVFCIDKSSSMEGHPFVQAQEALYTILPQLNSNDRFALVFFAGEAFPQFPTDRNLLTATPEHIAEGLNFVESREARGGTNIDEALQISLNRIPTSDRLKLIVFLTDGLTRKGETDPHKIIENIADANIGKNVQVYSFGFAWELNMNLLKMISTDTLGEAARIHPTENIDDRLSDFFQTIAIPYLKDMTIDFEGAIKDSTFPKDLPILFNGSEIIVVGKYFDENPMIITVTATSAQGQQIFSSEFNVTDPNLIHSFVPKLWAIHRINYLLDQMLLEGEIPRFVEEIMQLSAEFGLVTPYTSILIDPKAFQEEVSQEDLLGENTQTTITGPSTTPGTTTIPPQTTSPLTVTPTHITDTDSSAVMTMTATATVTTECFAGGMVPEVGGIALVFIILPSILILLGVYRKNGKKNS